MAKRLWVFVFGIAASLALAAVVPASGNNDSDDVNAREAERLADFLILAVKPEGDARDYKMVEIGDTKIDASLLGVVVKTLPFDFLGLGPAQRDYDEAAEVAQCRAACRANTLCRDFAYVRPGRNQPMGVCHLKRRIPAGNFGVMAPVVEDHERGERPVREPVPEKPAPATASEPPRETIPPPPKLPMVAVYFPLPPRLTPTAPPTDITVPRPVAPPIEGMTPIETTEPAPPAVVAETPPPARKRGLPLWLALGAVAVMFAGAGVYWRNHRVRTMHRLTTRLVSDGLAGRTVTIDLADDANHSLRFVVRAPADIDAPATRIELIPKGATA